MSNQIITSNMHSELLQALNKLEINDPFLYEVMGNVGNFSKTTMRLNPDAIEPITNATTLGGLQTTVKLPKSGIMGSIITIMNATTTGALTNANQYLMSRIFQRVELRTASTVISTIYPLGTLLNYKEMPLEKQIPRMRALSKEVNGNVKNKFGIEWTFDFTKTLRKSLDLRKLEQLQLVFYYASEPQYGLAVNTLTAITFEHYIEMFNLSEEQYTVYSQAMYKPGVPLRIVYEDFYQESPVLIPRGANLESANAKVEITLNCQYPTKKTIIAITNQTLNVGPHIRYAIDTAAGDGFDPAAVVTTNSAPFTIKSIDFEVNGQKFIENVPNLALDLFESKNNICDLHISNATSNTISYKPIVPATILQIRNPLVILDHGSNSKSSDYDSNDQSGVIAFGLSANNKLKVYFHEPVATEAVTNDYQVEVVHKVLKTLMIDHTPGQDNARVSVNSSS